MAVESLLDRINRMDFFAVLPSGFYSTVTATFCIVVPSGTRNVIEALRPIADRLGDNPVYLVFLLFAAYLVGSIIRAFRVVWAERASPPFRSGFPFSEELKKALAEIKQSKATGLDVARVPSIDNGLSGNIFNYWKDVLCLKTERGFEYYQSFETRARFSAGMVWAGVIGMLTAVCMAPRCFGVAWQMLTISIGIYLAFGFHLRRVRRQEAKALLFLYVAHLQP